MDTGLSEKSGYSENISILGIMAYQVKVEIISSYEFSLHSARRAFIHVCTSNQPGTYALWNAREEKFFAIDVVIAHSEQHTSTCS